MTVRRQFKRTTHIWATCLWVLVLALLSNAIQVQSSDRVSMVQWRFPWKSTFISLFIYLFSLFVVLLYFQCVSVRVCVCGGGLGSVCVCVFGFSNTCLRGVWKLVWLLFLTLTLCLLSFLLLTPLSLSFFSQHFRAVRGSLWGISGRGPLTPLSISLIIMHLSQFVLRACLITGGEVL